MSRQTKLLAGVVSTSLSFASFYLMDSVTDRSATEDDLNAAGYVLCGLALFFLFSAMRSPI